MKSIKALGLLALAAPGALAQDPYRWVVTVAKYRDDACTNAVKTIAVQPASFASLISDGTQEDVSCFGSGEGNTMRLQEDDNGCRVQVFDNSACSGSPTTDAKALDGLCMELPGAGANDPAVGYSKLGCIEVSNNPDALPADVLDVSDSIQSGVDEMKAMMQAPAAPKVVGSLQSTGLLSKFEEEKGKWKAALAETLMVEEEKVQVAASNMPLKRRRALLQDESSPLFIQYTVEAENDNAAASLESLVNDSPDGMAHNLVDNLSNQGVHLEGGLKVEKASTAEGICTNNCNSFDRETRLSPEFWARLMAGEEAELTTLGPALFGLPRKQPTNGFVDYEGVFDVTSVDYLASVAFMGIIGYVLALLSLLCIVLGVFWVFLKPLLKCCFSCCCKKGPPKLNVELTGFRKYLPMFFMLLFTGLVCIGCFLVFAGGPKLIRGGLGLLDVIADEVDTLDESAEIINAAFTVAADNLPELESLRENGQNLKDAVDQVDEMIDDNKASLDAYIKQSSSLFSALAGVFLVVAVIATLSGEFGWSFLLTIFKHLAHLMTVVAWLIFGVTMTVAVVMSDLCTSMEVYLEDPAASSLDSLMPCLEPKVAVETMNVARMGITDAMLEIQGPGTPFGTIVNLNARMYGNMYPLCEPYSKTKVGDVCAGDTEEFLLYQEQLCQAYYNGDLSSFDDAYVDSTCIQCCTPLFKFDSTFSGLVDIPEKQWKMAIKGVTAADALRAAAPPIESLLGCEFVTSAFDGMVHGRTCEGLVGGLELFVAGMALVGVGYTFLWITWNVAAGHIDDRIAAKKAQKQAMKSGGDVQMVDAAKGQN